MTTSTTTEARTMPMDDGCLCYTTDIGYALPTLVSAAQARANLQSRTDVVIILVGATKDDEHVLASVCAVLGIVFLAVPRDAIDGLPIQFARHFLDRLLDSRYRQVAHLDGDTQICGSLDPLFDVDPAPGRVIAVADPMALLATSPGNASNRHLVYLAGIGIDLEAAASYVNTGLFRVRRDDLGFMGENCKRLALREKHRFMFGEQDAFNIVLKSSIDLASMRWNYPAFFYNFRFEFIVAPRVRHFMSNPRPWQGPFLPWGQEGYRPYFDLVRRHPALGRFHRPFDALSSLRYIVQQRVKRIVEPWAWDRHAIRTRITEIERSCIV